MRDLGDGHLKKNSKLTNLIGLPIFLVVVVFGLTVFLNRSDLIEDAKASVVTGFLAMLLIAHIVTMTAIVIHERAERKAVFGHDPIRRMYLYNWTGRVKVTERLYYDLFTRRTDVTIENLNRMKTRILTLCSDDLEELYVLRDYVVYLQRSNLSNKLLITLKSFFTALCFALIPIIIQWIFEVGHVGFTWMIILISVVYLFAYLYKIFSTDKHRLLLISLIIDSCIRDEEARRGINNF